MKADVVLSFDIENPEELAIIIDKMDPTELPRFSGKLRVCFDPVATVVEEFLDAE